jgi:hypothetical protein
MAAQFPVLSEKLIAFIESQQLFFVATATEEGRINLSPKGADTLRVLSESSLLWVNFTGSGNETAAHLRQTDRMTMMFCSFTDQPLILRCYGKARAYHPRDSRWQELAAQVPEHPSSRQLVLLEIEMVQTSCGFGVPFYEYQGERDNMEKWLAAKSPADIETYWQDKNQFSIDGMATGIVEDDV